MSYESDDRVEYERDDREQRVRTLLAIDADDREPPARGDGRTRGLDSTRQREVVKHGNHRHEVIALGVSRECRIDHGRGRPRTHGRRGEGRGCRVGLHADHVGEDLSKPAK